MNPADRTRKTYTDDPLTHRIIGAAIEVHRLLGPGLLESTYEECLCLELTLAGIPFERQVSLPIVYKSISLLRAYKPDLLIERSVIVELKTVEKIVPLHEAQLLTYLRLSGLLFTPAARVTTEEQATKRTALSATFQASTSP